jgi:UDP-glucose 4-epimerase
VPPAVVLVTGVSRWLGGALAAELASDPRIDRVIGVDTVPPAPEVLRRLGRTEFVRADIRSPLIAKVIDSASVDTVVHMNISASPAAPGGRVSMKELNVIGTMQLLAACQRSPQVRRLVLKSSTAVGSSPRDPAVFTETMQARRVPSGGFGRDSLDIEGYVRGFARRRPDVGVSVLRFTDVIGPRIDSQLAGFLRLPVVPTVLGQDARLQVLHEDDAVAVLTRATTGEHVGTVNVAASGTVLLSQAVRRLGRVALPLPEPTLGSAGRLTRRAGLPAWSPEQLRFLNAGRVVDTRVLREEFGFTPRYTTDEALADYGRTLSPVVSPELVATATTSARVAVGQVARGAAVVGGLVGALRGHRPQPAPVVPGLRAVHDA